MYTSDKEAIILEHIYNDDSLKQRELADKAGISLGMVNAILKRLIEKGWLMTKRLNQRNISYVVSPAGIEEIFKRSYRYFMRTIDNINLYREKIEQLVAEAMEAGYNSITLVGKSDLEFLVEYTCGKMGIGFKKGDANQINGKMYILYGEQYEPINKIQDKHWLRNIIITQKASEDNDL